MDEPTDARYAPPLAAAIDLLRTIEAAQQRLADVDRSAWTPQRIQRIQDLENVRAKLLESLS